MVGLVIGVGMRQYWPVGEPVEVSEFRKLEPGRVAAVMVDFQNDFCRSSVPGQDGAQISGNAETARRANVFAGRAAVLGVRVIYSQQVMDAARLTPRQRRWEKDSQLCLAGSAGADLFIQPVAGSRIVRKYRYDIWQSPEFLAALADWDIDGLVIGGVELTCCVLHAVLGAEERGYQYVVPMDLVSGIRSSEPVANGAVRDYLRSVHPHIERADDLLRTWRSS